MIKAKEKISRVVKKLFARRWLLMFVIILLSLGGFFLFKSDQSPLNTQKKNQDTYTVTKKDLKETLTISGEVDAQEKALLRFQSSGRLAWVGVKKRRHRK